MAEDLDRRVRRTKRALAAALIDLTAERAYAAIQVRDITDRADVGYATFYRHYNSKDDLMLAVFDDITRELEAPAGEPGQGHFEQEGRRLFEHVQAHEGLYRSILQSPEFVGKLKKLLARRIEGHLARHARGLRAAFPRDLAANHMTASLVGLIEWWLERGQPLLAAGMARIYERLIIRATWFALDSSNELPQPWHS